MNKKILAIIIVVVIAVAAVAVVVLMNNGGGNNDKGLSIVGRVNSEGSGIILDPSQDPGLYIWETKENPGFGAKCIYNQTNETYYVFYPEAWGGKIFATPGAATIQHIQLMELANLMGLNYVSYTDGMELKKDTLYYMAGVPSFAEFENKLSQTKALVGYIIWEAQYSVGLTKGYEGLALTNDLFSGHTCCIIGASNKFLKNSEDVMLNFLAVYAKAVDEINVALQNPDSENYGKLVGIAMNRVSMPDGLTYEEKMRAVVSSLNDVTYLYADDDTGNMLVLETDIAELAESLVTANLIDKTPKDLGFSSYYQLAQKFVDKSYMKGALNNNYSPLSKMTKITVAAISGDIHQIALWYAKDTGMFTKANLDVVVSGQSNGPGVYVQLANKETDIGFLGAPPMTIRCMNGEDIVA